MSGLWQNPGTATSLALLLTLGAYGIGLRIYQASGRNAILHPAIIAIVLLMALLKLSGVSYQSYFHGAWFIHFLLGPATVALGVPLYQNIDPMRSRARSLLPALGLGAATAIVSAVLIAWLLGAHPTILRSLAPKSVTTPIAMAVAQELGGLPALAAGMVLITGAIGCMIAPLIYRRLGINDPAVQGFALGVNAHGFGTAKAFEFGPMAGAFAVLGLCLSGALTAILLPLLWRLLGAP